MESVDFSDFMEIYSDKFRRCMKHLAEPYLREKGLRFHHILFIYHIGMSPGTSQKDLREHLPLDKSRVSMVITELTGMGLVRDINQGKASELMLTESGAEIFSEVKVMAQDLKRRLLDGFTEEEMAVLRGCLDRFVANMDVILKEKDARGV